MTTDSLNLLPCPFCGSECSFSWRDGQPTNIPTVAGCDICGATTSLCATKEDASRAWNKRHKVNQEDDLSEILEDMYSYGNSFIRDGKHIPHDEIFAPPKDYIDELIEALEWALKFSPDGMSKGRALRIIASRPVRVSGREG